MPRSSKKSSKVPFWQQAALNGAAALFAVLLYSVTVGQLGGHDGDGGETGGIVEELLFRQRSHSGQNSQMLSVMVRDRHEIHGAYVDYHYPRVSFETLAGTFARAPPTLESLTRPLPTDLVDLFDETLQPAPGEPTVDVVIGVLSDSAEQRQLIRNTWGATNNKDDPTRVFFVVGASTTDVVKTIEKEQSKFQDVLLVQSGDKTVQSMIFAAAVVKYIPNTRHLLTVLEDTTYVRADALQQVSRTQLKDVPYWGRCAPNGVKDKVFFQVPSEWKSSGMFPYPEFPKTAQGAYLISWKIAQCATHIASAVPPLPDAAKNMAVLARDCRVPCYHDERVQASGYRDMGSDQTMLIRTGVVGSEAMQALHTKLMQLPADAILQYKTKPQASPFPYQDPPPKKKKNDSKNKKEEKEDTKKKVK